MGWKTLYLLSFTCGYINFNACSTNRPENSEPANNIKLDTSYKKVNFDSTILSLARKSENSETWDVLFYFKDFNNIYEHSSAYLSDAIAFLSNEGFNERQKKICLCTMQRVTLKDYVRIVKVCKNLFDSSKVSEDVLGSALVPNFSKSHLIVRNYNEANVRNLLTDISQDKKVSTTLVETVQNILTGSLWQNIRDNEGS